MINVSVFQLIAGGTKAVENAPTTPMHQLHRIVAYAEAQPHTMTHRLTHV